MPRVGAQNQRRTPHKDLVTVAVRGAAALLHRCCLCLEELLLFRDLACLHLVEEDEPVLRVRPEHCCFGCGETTVFVLSLLCPDPCVPLPLPQALGVPAQHAFSSHHAQTFLRLRRAHPQAQCSFGGNLQASPREKAGPCRRSTRPHPGATFVWCALTLRAGPPTAPLMQTAGRSGPGPNKQSINPSNKQTNKI